MENEIFLPKGKEFEEIYIPVPWGHIAGCWYGERNIRPILALHGWLDNYGTWDTLIPLMPPHISVLAIDFAGHGKSSRLPEGIFYDSMHYVGDIIRIMKHYNWDKVSIMAHSMSCYLAFIFTAFYPERVDMLIQLDYLHPQNNTPIHKICMINYCIETYLLEQKRILDLGLREPTSFSEKQLIRRVQKGSSNSVEEDKCKHIIRTNVTKSTLFPSKYYFSLDPRLKGYMAFLANKEFLLVMANRIKIPQIIIKGSKSNLVDEEDPIVEFLRQNNPYFEFHILEGTHHVHLNNARETSVLVNSFLRKWKPQSNNVLPVDKVKPQPHIYPIKPHQGWKMEKAKL